MAELDDLSITDASNTGRFPENMQFRNVNDSGRALEGMIAREYKDRNMSLAASGSSNAFTVASNRTLTAYAAGLTIGFTANHSITGSATLNVSGLGAKTIVAQNGSAVGSGDIVNGQKVLVAYRAGTDDWQMVGGRVSGASADVLARITPVGIVAPWPGTTAPSGWLFAFGQAVSRTTYAELYAAYGTTYGSGDGSTTFNLPDYRGRTPFGRDDMGGSAASRVTTAGSTTDGATLGAVGGAQNVTLTTAQIPSHNHTASVSDPGHAHAQTVTTDGGLTGPSTGGGFTSYAFDGAQNTSAATTGISVSIGSTGGGGAHTNMPPAIIQNWIILALPALASAANTGVNGLLYTFSSSTSGAPGDGKIGFNDATLSDATGFRISETDFTGAPMGPVLATWDDSTSTIRGTLYVYKVGQLSTYAVFQITGSMTDSGAYDSFSANYVSDNGTFAEGDQLAVLFVAKGDAGDAGSPGAGINWQGAWLTATAFATADGVSNGGSSYICTSDHTSGSTTEPGVGASWATVWDLIAAKGASGSGSGDMVAANNLSDVASAATAFANIKQAASESATGVVELATTAEATTGTDTTRAITAAGLKAHVDARDGTSAAASITDNRLVRGDGGTRGLQESPVIVDDSGNTSGIGTLSTSGVVTAGTTSATAVKLDPSGFVELPEVSAPSTPASGFMRLYVKTDGKAYQKNDAGTETDLSQSGGGASGHGQCRLTKSSTNLLLSPYCGNQILINGAAQTIPDAGVTLSTSGLSTTTLYFIYVYMNSGTMTLEASATGHATDTTAGNNGVEIKSGDATRTLVGMGRTNGSTAWVDSDAQRFVVSWFNRRNITTTNTFTASRNSTTGSTYTEVNSEIRNEFLAWAEESVVAGIGGAGFLNVSSDQVYVGIGFDGATPEQGNLAFQGTAAIGPLGMVIGKSGLSEGYHYATITAKQTTGSSAFTFVSASTGQRCALSCILRG